MSRPPHSRPASIILPLLLTGLVVWMAARQAAQPSRQDTPRATNHATSHEPGLTAAAEAQASPAPSRQVAAPALDLRASEPVDRFRAWLSRHSAADDAGRAALLPEGLALAQARRARMARLIREAPEQALREGLRLHEFAALPAELRPLVETPFSELAPYRHYPICNAPPGTPDHLAQLSLQGAEVAAHTYGRRGGLMSKNALPAQGIALDGQAALHELPLRPLETAEAAMAQKQYPTAQADAGRSFLTGQPIAGEPVIALGGGRIFHLASPQELDQLNEALTQMEQLPGPDAGSDALFYQARAADGSGSFDLPQAMAAEQAQASAWTETEKQVFIIRVDFSDRTGASHGQEETAQVLHEVVSPQIRAMSYGKTWITAGVSENVYRMPQTSAWYVNGTSGDSRNNELLRDARNTFRNQRTGGDAAVNIGPVSSTGTGSGGGLGGYDIVGVLFTGMNMRSGIAYGGLAGGGDLWMQGNIDEGVFTHEFGHNYGIGHSSLWKTSDGSVLGTGSSTEYGDVFDIMGSGDLPQAHFHPQAKALLNWLSTSEWTDTTAAGSGTYRLRRIDSQFTTGSPRGLRITRSATSPNQQYLWLGYRPIYAGIPRLARGAYMVWQRPGQNRSWLVDATPATSGVLSDAPIQLGQTFADATSRAFITPLAVGGTGDEAWLDVQVNYGPYTGNTAPTVGAISGPASVAARASSSFSVTASDGNGDTLAYAWNAGDGAVPDNLPSLQQSWTVGGGYTLSLTVSDMKGGATTVTKSITVTDPLDTWTSGSLGTGKYMRELIHADGRFVGADYFGELFLSWDGVSWASAGTPPDLDEPRLAHGAGVFVAAGQRASDGTAARIVWSADGRRWNIASHPQGVPAVTALAYGNGRFLALGAGGTVLTSMDGMAWTVSTVPEQPNFKQLAWTGGGWVAVAAHPTSTRPEVIWTSPDGVSWTQRSTRGVDIDGLHVHGGRCYAVGWYAGISYSDDHGLTWQDAALPEGSRWTTRHLASAPDGTLLCLAQAMDESGTPHALLVSTDGLRWVRAAGNTTVAANAQALAYGNGRFVTVEDNGVVRRSNVLFPGNTAPSASFTSAPATGAARQPILMSATASDADGDTLTFAWDFGPSADARTGPDIAPSFAFGGSYSLTLRVSDGRGGMATLEHSITISDPARSFTNRLSSAAAGDFQAIATGGGRVVAVGSLYSGSFNGPWAWSTNGSSWTTGSLGSNRSLVALVHDGTQFIGAGRRYDFTAPAGWRGWIATSPDGETWTQRHFAGLPLNAIAAGGGVWLAAGEEGTLLRSTDGISWSSVTLSGISAQVTFAGLAWNGSVFLLTGYTGTNGGVKVLTSSDGLEWMDRSSGAGVQGWQDLQRTAWLHDRFVSSGWYSKLRVSTDGGGTFTTTRSGTEETPALAYGNGVWFAAGVDRDASDADVDLLSLDGSTWYSFAAPTTQNRRGAAFFQNTLITVGDAGSIWQSGAIPLPAGFPVWQAENFPAGGPDAQPGADPDKDGIPNYLEYALRLMPLATDTAAGQAVYRDGRLWLRLDMPENPRADVRHIIQGSSTLMPGSWTEIARKNGSAAWSWTAGGSAQITTGAASGGYIPTEIGLPDARLGDSRHMLRLVVEPQ